MMMLSEMDPGRRTDMVIDRYEKYLLEHKKNKPRTVQVTIMRINNWLGGDNSSKPITEHTPISLTKVYENRCDSVAVDTHRNELKQVKTFFRWAVKNKIINKSPVEAIEGQGKRNTHKKQLRVNEARLWTRTAEQMAENGERGAIAALIAIYLGPRAGEIVTRTIRDIDDNCQLFWIPTSKTPSGRRIVEIPAELQPYMRKLVLGRSPHEYLFPSVKNPTGHMTVDWVRKWVKRICIRANVPIITAHGLRGLHATIAEEHGISGHAVAKNLGHDTVKVTHGHYTAPGTSERATARKTAQILARDNG